MAVVKKSMWGGATVAQLVAVLGLLAAGPAMGFTGRVARSGGLSVRPPVVKLPQGINPFQPKRAEPLNSAAAAPGEAAKPSLPTRFRKAMFEDGGNQKTLAVAVATCLSWYLNNKVGYGPVKGAAITGTLLGATLPPALRVPALAGAFTGMCSDSLAPSLGLAARLGIVTGLLLTLADRKSFIAGRGGRLGVVAIFSCTLAFLLDRALPMLSNGFPVPPTCLVFNAAEWNAMLASAPLKVLANGVAVSVAAAFISKRLLRFLQARSIFNQVAHPVFAASLTVLGFCFYPGGDGPALAGASIALSAAHVLPTGAAIFLAAVLAEVVRFGMTGSVIDWGGRIGTAATIAVIATFRLGKKVPMLAEPKAAAPAPAPAPAKEPAPAAA